MNQEFTFQQAFLYQINDISDWSKKLNTETYSILLEKVLERNNKGYDSPYDVLRGGSLNNIIANIYKN